MVPLAGGANAVLEEVALAAALPPGTCACALAEADAGPATAAGVPAALSMAAAALLLLLLEASAAPVALAEGVALAKLGLAALACPTCSGNDDTVPVDEGAPASGVGTALEESE